MNALNASDPLALWGGIECTVNRVGNVWLNQLERNGHAARPGDLQLVADLGIRTLRYPLLWELLPARPEEEIDWRWADERLASLRALGIDPIVGLTHHGSGPPHTSLIEANFAPGLAAYAGQVAARFPWVEQYTPVNEPLTTARFSCLYGHWFPHARDDRLFARALINQCRATALAMRAIRTVNSNAKLIQTDDLGTTYAAPGMQAQADFDNERRWLGWDLLCGRVDARHPMRTFLLDCGIGAPELDWFVDDPCPPDVIGINHYVTSDRFLDDDLAHYAPNLVGSNGRQRYVDIDAVRALRGSYRGWQVLNAAWQRYQLPIAITEAHLGCTREEQVRWLQDAWTAALEARANGSHIRAVTAWALFGSFNWDTLLTAENGHYEPGAFDVRAPQPRATAVAQRIQEIIAHGEAVSQPWASHGWWHGPQKSRDERAFAPLSIQSATPLRPRSRSRPILICGSGTLGRSLANSCSQRGLDARLAAHADLDICDEAAVESLVAAMAPWAIINAAGYVRVDDAERDENACFRGNLRGPEVLADAASRHRLPLVTFSSDLVFDGQTDQPYVESSQVRPLNAYGRSKAAAETASLALHADTLCIRTAAFFGYWEPGDFLATALAALDSGERFGALDDVIVSPTYLPDLVNACLDLLIDRSKGIWHLTNQGAVSWADFAERAAIRAGVDVSRLDRLAMMSCDLPARRPRYSALTSERGLLLPTLEHALDRFAALATESFLPRSRQLHRAAG